MFLLAYAQFVWFVYVLPFGSSSASAWRPNISERPASRIVGVSPLPFAFVRFSLGTEARQIVAWFYLVMLALFLRAYQVGTCSWRSCIHRLWLLDSRGTLLVCDALQLGFRTVGDEVTFLRVP